MSRVVSRVLSYVFGVGLVILVWYKFPATLLGVLDQNLLAIKWVCSQLPIEYAKMVEVALRVNLHADKALLFAEGAWVVNIILTVLWFIAGRFWTAASRRNSAE